MEPPDVTPDEELIRRMAAGSAQAFSELYERHGGRVYRFALHYTNSPECAQDVTQETFLFLMRSGGAYDSRKGPLVNWRVGVARNCARRSGRLGREDELDGGPEPADGRFDILHALTRKEAVQSIRDAVGQLPPAYREVVALCELQEMEYGQAAAVLGCPIGTVRSRLHRARRILMTKLQAFACV